MQQFGVIGLSVMGKNLALNVKNHGFSVSGFSIDKHEVDALAKYKDKNLKPTYTWEEFVDSLEKPRKILIMIQAGDPVDQTLAKLKGLLSPGDIIIDGGNSNFHDTNRRYKELEADGIHFIGMGVSGGEEGALNGPALMPGGDKKAYEEVSPILEAIAAKTPTGQACVGYTGPAGAGHYVKMVHNGIEYGVMQIIAESYDILRKIGNYSNIEMSDIYAEWNKGRMEAYLIEITSAVLKQKDNLTDGYVIDKILNEASYKGTGNWMLEDAIRLGTPITVIAEAVMARFMSKATFRDDPEPKINLADRPENLVENLAKALYLAMAVSYAQGFEQMNMAAKAYNWRFNFSTIAQNWEAGCIIHSQMLHDIKFAYNADSDLENIFKAPFFDKIKKENINALKEIIEVAAADGVPTPTLSAALNYLVSIFNPNLPQNIIQGQRDYFGAHTYLRSDRPGVFHTEWYEEK